MSTQPKAGINDDDDDDDQYLDLEQLSRYSSLSVRTLQRHLKAAEHPLPYHQVCVPGKKKGRVLVGKRAFKRWMDHFLVGGWSATPDEEADDFSWIKARKPSQ
jgi:hypothetical protein